MATKLIRLKDGTLVQVEIEGEQQSQQVSGKLAEKVEAGFDQVQGVLIKACQPVVAAWKELNKDVTIDQAEVELALSFEATGNLFVANSKAGVNLRVKLVLKQPVEPSVQNEATSTNPATTVNP